MAQVVNGLVAKLDNFSVILQDLHCGRTEITPHIGTHFMCVPWYVYVQHPCLYT